MQIFCVIIIVITLSTLLTIFLDRFFAEKKIIKYIPSMIMVPLMVYNLVTMFSISTDDFQRLGKFIMGLFLLSAILPSLVCSISFDIYRKISCQKNNLGL